MSSVIGQYNVEKTGPLSYGQRALWFLWQLAPQSAAYNVMMAAQTYSAVDVPALKQSFQTLVDRHPSLRTRFPSAKGKPIQQVLARQPVDFQQVDASRLTWSELKLRLAEESHQPFNLETGPLLRVRLFTRSTQDDVLLVTAHHIVIDFLSFAIILDELRTLYPASRTGLQASLRSLSGHYLDYVKWQEEMLSGPEGERLWQYWQRQLKGPLPVLDLPPDHPRRQVQTFRGAARFFRVGSQLSARLQGLAETEGVSLYVLLLAAFQSLLHHYTGQTDILVGSPPLEPRRAGWAGIVGFFHNPAVLRANLSGDATFTDFLQRVNRTVSEAFAHQDYPFALLVERLQPARDLTRSPIFQVMFVLYEAGGQPTLPFLAGQPGSRIDLGGLDLQYLDVEQRAAMLDLTMTMLETDEELSGCLQYNSDLFEPNTIDAMIDRFTRLLQLITEAPAGRISALSQRLEANLLTAPLIEIPPASISGEENNDGGERRIDFSLFYFGSDYSEAGSEKYRLLIEGAKFADRNGFDAVWTPERHFHAYGGLYPNPAITSAALATITERVHLRAGSVVLPLHNPIRAAEEWAMVDNLSNGRIGISIASGWHANDFVFAPENYARRKEVMIRQLETLRKLWRGEAVSFPCGTGNQIPVKILPRPVQRDLPLWLTSFGNLDTFRLAGELGINVLTHLLGQSIELLAEKIAIYREACRASGQGPGRVTLMLHTFVGPDSSAVRETIRAPFCNYLKSSLDLLVGLAQGSGLKIDPGDLTRENLDVLVEHAFNRYYETSGLLGRPETCIKTVEHLISAGVNEVACLIDFGVEADLVLHSLQHVTQVKEAVNRHSSSTSGAGASVSAPLVEETQARAELRRTLTKRRHTGGSRAV
jgi:natural product biosynthesis luciferase-like monooxygenase protein